MAVTDTIIDIFRAVFSSGTGSSDASLRVSLNDIRQSAFDEVLTGTRSSILNLRPTWGVSDLRDLCVIDGVTTLAASLTSNDIAETNGEIVIKSGTNTNNSRLLRTIERGQYQPGSEAEYGLGIRIPTSPAGGSTNDIRWGAFDTNNGLGFGVDGTGTYVFRLSAGSITKTYQSSWNQDQLDGSGGASNPSGLTLTLSDGVIYNVIFVWYGYGTIRFFATVSEPTSLLKRTVEVHRINVTGQASIIEPNLPIAVMNSNGASSTTNLSACVGGRQYSVVGNLIDRDRRVFAESAAQVLLPTAQNVWHPLICLRRKSTFGTSSRENSVRVFLNGADFSTDNPAELRVTYRAVTSGGTYAAPTDVPAIESACETKVQSGSTISTSVTGTRVIFAQAENGRNTVARIEAEESVAMGSTLEAVLWVRRLTTTATTVSAVLRWEEDW